MSGTQTSASNQAATPGNWITQTINGLQYDVLLPANYDPNVKYPTMLYLHQLDMGDDPSGLLAEVNPWFNTTAFRTATPAIIVMPLLNQTADPSGETINFGGVTTADSTGEDNAIAALQQVLSQYSTDPSRVYVTGNSMGGIGTEDMLIKYNAYTGTEGKIFAAGLSLAGADYGQGYPQPNTSVVTALKNVPFWAIHGGQDTTVPLTWDQNLYAAEQAIDGDMQYTQDNSLGHDVWDTYYTQTGASSPLGWLFSQQLGGATPIPTATLTPSSNDTVVMAGSSTAITDANGNIWTISSGGQVAVNGAADTTTANVVELAYVNGTIWQENSNNLWWGETQPNAAWSPAAGTATSPLPAMPTPLPAPTPTAAPTSSSNDTVVMAGSSTAITDANGNIWTISSGGQVAVNGAADTTTANVVELAYVNGTIWQENSNNLWWGETQPNAAWSPAAGTATSPLPADATPAASANDRMIIAGSSGTIIDSAGNTWAITAGSQVAINGIVDTTTGNVTELAYVNNEVWQANANKLWWGKTSPTDPWGPAAGTSTSPLPAPIKIASHTTNATVSQSEVSVAATAGSHTLFISGSGDIITLSAAANTVTDTGGGNMFVFAAASIGTTIFTSNITTIGDTLDLANALAATDWNGSASTLSNYLTVTNSAQNATLSIADKSGGPGVAIATISGAGPTTLSSLLAHAIT